MSEQLIEQMRQAANGSQVWHILADDGRYTNQTANRLLTQGADALTAAQKRLAAVERSNEEYQNLLMHLRQELIAGQKRMESLEYENQRLRELVQSYEPDRERLEFYERELDEIGRALGCDHKDDGYLRCVTSTIEDAQQRVAELEQAITIAIATAANREDEWGERAVACFEILREKLNQ